MKRKHIFWIILMAITVLVDQPDLFSQVVINEYSASNLTTIADNYGAYEDWMELYNTSAESINLEGYYLSDKLSDSTKWQFPAGVTITGHGFLKIWLSGRDEAQNGNYHTNFKLTQTKDNGEYVVLTNPQGVVIEQHLLEITQKEHSRGRVTNGSDTWGIFTNPTPGSSNNSANSYAAYTAKPSMDSIAGFYPGAITLTITNNEPNSVVRFTTDGADPGASSPVYSSPVNISSTTIVKARAFSNDPSICPGLIEFKTYFIGVTHTLAVMSIAGDQIDNLLNGNGGLIPYGSFEYFNKNKVRTTYGYGSFNEHGQDSWVHPQRSIDYITRDECGYNYAIREKMIEYTDRDEFQRVILRAQGDDNYPGIDTSAHLRDYFIENTACKHNLHLDVRKGATGLLYVNGQYWGVYGFREKVSDSDFTKYYYNQDKYHLYYLMLWGGSWAEYGGQPAWDDWNALHDFIKFNDMSNQDNFEYVKEHLDYTTLVDYILLNSYVVCSDWINWNVGWWRGTNPEGTHLKWGYTLWDEDATFGHYINYTGVPGQNPYVSPCYPEGLTNDPEQHILLLNRLRDNAEFDQYYISRYIDLINTVFRPDTMITYLDEIEAMMLPEMQGHCDRWGGSVAEWQVNVQKIRNFITIRNNILPSGLKSCYDLTGPYEFQVNTDPPGAGEVGLNSLVLDKFPWGGYYYGGIDIKLKALETNNIYEFDKWILNNSIVTPSDSAKEVILNLTSGDNLIAKFKLKPFGDSLVINEINYNSAPDANAGDWVEFYNPNTYALDITDWQFKDSDDQHVFTFPSGTLLEPNGYLVLVRDSASFTGVFPDVQNFIGEMGFGLSSSGELIRLFNAEGALIDTVHFEPTDPWPPEANGEGPTLELMDWQFDNALPESWVAWYEHGTPGQHNSYFVSVPEKKEIAKPFSFVIYPNPVTSSAVLQVTSGPDITNGELIIYNIFGREVKRINGIHSNRVEIKKGDLNAGVYSCRLNNIDTGVFETVKMVVE